MTLLFGMTGGHHQVADSIHLKDFNSIQSDDTIQTVSDHPENRFNQFNMGLSTEKIFETFEMHKIISRLDR